MNFFGGLKEVFSKPYYILVALSGVILFYLLNVIIADFSDLKMIANGYGGLTSLKLLFNYFLGYPLTIDNYSIIILFTVAVLFGTYLAMAIYKTGQINNMGKKYSLIGSLGVFFGVLAPGCAACGLGLASLFGFAGFLVALPFKGIEISIIAFLLLGYANFNIASKITQNTCSIKLK